MDNFNAPQGFKYDPQNGRYFNKNLTRDAKNELIEVTTWYDPTTGLYSSEIHKVDIPNKGNPKKIMGMKPASFIILISTIIIIALLIVVIVLLKRDSDSKGDNSKPTTQETTTDSNNNKTTSEYIICNGDSPMNHKVEDMEITIGTVSTTTIEDITVSGCGDMTGQFLINPYDSSSSENLYMWHFYLDDNHLIRFIGESVLHENDFIYKVAKDYIKCEFIELKDDGYNVLKELAYEATTDGFTIKSVDISPYVNIDIMLSKEGTTSASMKHDSYIEFGEVKFNIIETTFAKSTDTASVAATEDTETVTEIEKPTEATTEATSFKYAGAYYCQDSSLGEYNPSIILEADGSCVFYANLGDGMYKLEGYYTYQQEAGEYSDQGEIYNIDMYFPDCSDDMSHAQLVLDTEGDTELLLFLTSGFGLMGGDNYYAGYFYRKW